MVAGTPVVSAQRNNNNRGAAQADVKAHPLRYLEPTEDEGTSSSAIIGKAINQDT